MHVSMKRLKLPEVARDIVRWLNHANVVVHRPPKNSRENNFCENGPAVHAVTRQHPKVAHGSSNLSVVGHQKKICPKNMQSGNRHVSK